ncbi:E3 ubiquitin-protein ligase TRIM71-like [Glandiceps talaboti]
MAAHSLHRSILMLTNHERLRFITSRMGSGCSVTPKPSYKRLPGEDLLTEPRQVTIPAGEDAISKRLLECPMCLQFFKYAKEALKQAKSCRPCIENNKFSEPEVFCTNCRVAFCHECKLKHKKIPIAKSHILDKIDDYRKKVKESPFERPVACPRHGEEDMYLYCKTCEVPTCAECMRKDHASPGCVQERINEAMARRQSELRRRVEEARNISEQLAASLRTLEDENMENEARFGEINRKIETRSKEILQLLTNLRTKTETNGSELVKSFDVKFKERKYFIDKAHTYLDTQINKQQKSLDATDSLLEVGKGVGMLYLVTQAIHELNSNIQKMTDSTDTHVKEIRFIKNDTVLKFDVSTDMLGKLT